MKSVESNTPAGYIYQLSEPIGENFDPNFAPELTPKEMLELGVFGGWYFGEDKDEYPPEWFEKAKLNEGSHDKKLNFFGVNASQPLSVWKEKGWIYREDPRGWFQWYCRYYLGRRIPGEDQRQIKRWKAMVRHIQQIRKSCVKGDFSCHPKQRQALLHWAYDSRKL